MTDEIEIPSDRIRVLLFGPGYGESVVISVGERYVCQIDACRPAVRFMTDWMKSEQPPVLGFFLLTHPHSDHFQDADECLGLPFETLCRFAAATWPALQDALVARAASVRANRSFRNSVRSFRRFQHAWGKVGESRRRLALNGSLITRKWFRLPGGNRVLFEVMALSPRVGETELFERGLLSAINSGDCSPGGRLANNVSVVLAVTFGETRLLLTGDMGGAVLEQLECARYHLVKLPHHGSAHDNSAALLRSLLVDDGESVAMVSAFEAGDVSLPDPDLMSSLVANVLGGQGARLIRALRKTDCPDASAEWKQAEPGATVVAIHQDAPGSVTFDSKGQRCTIQEENHD